MSFNIVRCLSQWFKRTTLAMRNWPKPHPDWIFLGTFIDKRYKFTKDDFWGVEFANYDFYCYRHCEPTKYVDGVKIALVTGLNINEDLQDEYRSKVDPVMSSKAMIAARNRSLGVL